jgi:cobaltochelatase CobS
MVRLADMTRNAFVAGDLHIDSHLPDDLGAECRNSAISVFAFRLTFLNKCDELERAGGGILSALLW